MIREKSDREKLCKYVKKKKNQQNLVFEKWFINSDVYMLTNLLNYTLIFWKNLPKDLLLI